MCELRAQHSTRISALAQSLCTTHYVTVQWASARAPHGGHACAKNVRGAYRAVVTFACDPIIYALRRVRCAPDIKDT